MGKFSELLSGLKIHYDSMKLTKVIDIRRYNSLLHRKAVGRN